MMVSGQPEVSTTWNKFHAPTYWNMRLSVSGAVMDAHVQSNILLRDRTRSLVVATCSLVVVSLVVVGRRPHLNPCRSLYSPAGRPRRGVTAPPLGAV